ncbi:MAG: hypothetical protein AAF399_29645, partial [Bacteroidota bacterium]
PDAHIQPYVEAAILAQRWVDQDFDYTYQGENGPYRQEVKDQHTKELDGIAQFEAGVMLATNSGWGVQLGMNRTVDMDTQGVEEIKRKLMGVKVGVFYAFGG